MEPSRADATLRARQDLSQGTAFVLFLVAFGVLLAQSFVESLRVGTLGICWLYCIALLLGLGIGPTIGYFLENDGTVITQAAGCTALVTLGMGAGGFNYLRKHGTKADAIWLATGIFVSIVNIFLALLSIFDN